MLEVEDLEKKMDRQEQYSRRNCILIHGLKEEKNESRYMKNEDILLVDLDRTYRIGKKRDSNSKPRPVIVKFTRYNIREEVFKSKKKLLREKILTLQKILLDTE